jgi:hypothetical protein
VIDDGSAARTQSGGSASQTSDSHKAAVALSTDEPTSDQDVVRKFATPMMSRISRGADKAQTESTGSACGGVGGSIHIPIHELAERVGEVPDGQVWVYCGSATAPR